MTIAVIDDHLLRDSLTGKRTEEFASLGFDRLATTGLWLFRLCSAFASPVVAGKLSAPVTALGPVLQRRFREKLTVVPAGIEMVPLRDIAWSVAALQRKHRDYGRNLSAAMLEALGAAHHLTAAIVVSKHDIGPNLQAAAEADGVRFLVL